MSVSPSMLEELSLDNISANTSPDIIIYMTLKDKLIIGCNPSAQIHFGYEEHELVGRKFSDSCQDLKLTLFLDKRLDELEQNLHKISNIRFIWEENTHIFMWKIQLLRTLSLKNYSKLLMLSGKVLC
ncbi:MAG: PAS domain-containing protein [Gammaproteobacteria bacterium]